MNTKALSFATKIMVMAILISVVLLFVGIGVLVLIHLCIVGRAFQRGFRTMARPNNDRKRGLTPAELEKLPCYEFKAGENMSGTVDCVVCLESFEAGDRCRLLPPCRHSFHAKCVDSWLLKCSVCPICRTSASAGKATDGGWPENFGGSGANEGAEMRERQVVVVGVEFDQPVDHASSSR